MKGRKIPKFICKKIRNQRLAKGYESAQRLAENIGVSKDTIYRLEQGRHTAAGKADMICRFLDIDLHNEIAIHNSRVKEATACLQDLMAHDDATADLLLTVIRQVHQQMIGKRPPS